MDREDRTPRAVAPSQPKQLAPGSTVLSEYEQRMVTEVARLFEFFPDGSDSESRKLAYYDRLVKSKRSTEDVARVVDRLIETHESTKVPPYAKIMDRLREIATRRNEPEMVDLDRRDLSPEGIALDVERLRLYRGMDMPKRCSKRHGPKPRSGSAVPTGEKPRALPRMSGDERSLAKRLDATWRATNASETRSAPVPERRSTPDAPEDI